MPLWFLLTLLKAVEPSFFRLNCNGLDFLAGLIPERSLSSFENWPQCKYLQLANRQVALIANFCNWVP